MFVELNKIKLLKELNNEYEIYETKYYNKNLRDKVISIDMFDMPMIAGEGFVLGGCPREITFREIGFPVSDLSLYKIEKGCKDDFILNHSLEKLVYGLKYKYKNDENYYVTSSLDFAVDELIDPRRTCIEPFINSCIVKDYKNNTRTLFAYYLVKSDKDFREPDNIIALKLLPGIITMLENGLKLSEVVVIFKHIHSFEEKAVSFTKSEYLDSEVLVINNVPTSFDTHKYNELILKTVSDINTCIKEKKFSEIKNLNCCTECLHKRFCDTLP